MDIIIDTYQTDENAHLRECLGRQDLAVALESILDIYTHVVRCPQKQYQPDNRTITTRLV